MEKTLRKMLLKPACCILALLLWPAQVRTQNNEPATWNNGIGHSTWALALDRADRMKALDLWDAIGRDLENETHPLAGTYVKPGYNWGYFLRWSSRLGFVVIPYFDQNLITDFGHGKVRIINDLEVVFEPEKQLSGGRGLAKMPREWTVVFGQFTPVETLKEFGQYRAGFGSYNEFNGSCCEFIPSFLTRRIDRENIALPTGVTEKYRKYFPSAITAQIVSLKASKNVRDWGFQGQLYGEWIEKAVLTPVTINAGKLHGIRSNMLFRIVGEPRETGRYFQVIKVERQHSHGYIVHQYFDDGREAWYRDYVDDKDKRLPSIKTGTKVTSSPVID